MAIEAGSVVRLKSGGPAMSVQSVVCEVADVAWFAFQQYGMTLRREAFAVASLKVVDREAEERERDREIRKFTQDLRPTATIRPMSEVEARAAAEPAPGPDGASRGYEFLGRPV